ncbi:MAG: hypothetical protein SchgKO_22630 [Schleiferiaceae bacterium]
MKRDRKGKQNRFWKYQLWVASLFVFTTVACERERDRDEGITIPRTENFQQNLSSYNIYSGTLSDLIPNADYVPLELSSALFSNYAKKQRLVKLPAGTQMTYDGEGIPNFPEGTILVKTFYYPVDERYDSLGIEIVETRLLIKNSGLWNVAAYVWNADQTEATLDLNGHAKNVSWTDEIGDTRTIPYDVPNENDCAACHQKNEVLQPVGPTMRNLNIEVQHDSATQNQLEFLQAMGILNDFSIGLVGEIPDYSDQSLPLAERARAYMDMNCAHCHNPSGWRRPARQGFDFRYETTLSTTGILENKHDVKEIVQSGEMPYLGTTVLDEEGIQLMVNYINSL